MSLLRDIGDAIVGLALFVGFVITATATLLLGTFSVWGPFALIALLIARCS
jgi:hypothetical protein